MRHLLAVLGVLAALVHKVPAAEPIPKELQGYWVPVSAACSSAVGVHVYEQSVQFRSANLKTSFSVDTCFSCEGGARYAGRVVWAMPSDRRAEAFTVYFNSRERTGVTTVVFDGEALKSSFPIHELDLRRCDNKVESRARR